MSDPTPAILATLAELEEVARGATPGPWNFSAAWPEGVWAGSDRGDGIVHASWEEDACTPSNLAHIAHNDPAFVLGLVAALREVVALHGDAGLTCPSCAEADAPAYDRGLADYPCPTLRALARAFGGEGS